MICKNCGHELAKVLVRPIQRTKDGARYYFIHRNMGRQSYICRSPTKWLKGNLSGHRDRCGCQIPEPKEANKFIGIDMAGGADSTVLNKDGNITLIKSKRRRENELLGVKE